MADPMGDDAARNRWIVMNAVRLSGAVMVLVGMLGLSDVIAMPAIAGYIIIGVGLVDVFVVPQMLARKWRSPGE
jgi:membrane protein YdbS with pleckstrin-like domain